MDDPVNRVDAWGLWSWGDTVSAATTVATKMAEKAALIGSRLAGGLGILTAPLGDLISPDSLNDVEQDTKEYWDKWGIPTEPEDMRDRH